MTFLFRIKHNFKNYDSTNSNDLSFTCYCIIDNKYVYSYLDNDIARLIRLREALQTDMKSFEILCFPEQGPLLRKYLGPQVYLKFISMRLVEKAMGQKEEFMVER